MCNAIHLPLRVTAIVVFNILNTFPNYYSHTIIFICIIFPILPLPLTYLLLTIYINPILH